MTNDIAREIRVHTFDSSGDAYDASQYRDDIASGDVLAVPSECVVGYLHEAWPVAVTTEGGVFHRLTDGDWNNADAFEASRAMARKIATRMDNASVAPVATVDVKRERDAAQLARIRHGIAAKRNRDEAGPTA